MIRLTVVFLASCSLFAQSRPPKLPVVRMNACPGETCRFESKKATKTIPIFTDWRPSRKKVGTLPLGEEIDVLTGVYVVFKPERVRRVLEDPEDEVKVGEEILTYFYQGEGKYHAWVKGRMKEWVEGYATTLCNRKIPTLAVSPHYFCIVEPGHKEWWVQVKRKTGKIVWLKVDDNLSRIEP